MYCNACKTDTTFNEIKGSDSICIICTECNSILFYERKSLIQIIDFVPLNCDLTYINNQPFFVLRDNFNCDDKKDIDSNDKLK